MLRFHNIVFGPIHSRRLGSSLGINLLPEHGKLCNFDCIYCECGWNRDGRGDTVMPSADEVSHALEAKLKECAEQGTPIDSITFSGHGEPTLNPHFPEIIAQTVSLRDRYCPRAKVSVLTNATTVNRTEIFEALKKADRAYVGKLSNAGKIPPSRRMDTSALAALSGVHCRAFDDNMELLNALKADVAADESAKVVVFFSIGNFDSIHRIFAREISS